MEKKTNSSGTVPMSVINAHATGIDVGSREHYVAIGQQPLLCVRAVFMHLAKLSYSFIVIPKVFLTALQKSSLFCECPISIKGRNRVHRMANKDSES